MTNPFLSSFNTPFESIPFQKLQNNHFLPALRIAIEEAKKQVDEITNNKENPTFQNTLETLELSGELLSIVSGVAFNLNSSETSDELQEITKQMAPILSEHSNDILLNEILFKRIESVYKSKPTLTEEQNQLLEKTYKSFVRNGAKLNKTEKLRLREIDKQLSQISLEFGEHSLNEMNKFEVKIDSDRA